jgi:hypothetical protein
MPTLQKHVFDVLDRVNISYDVLWSTNTVSETVNTRGSHGVAGGIDQLDVRLLEPCLISLSDQEVVRLQEFNLFAHARGIVLDEEQNFDSAKYAHLDEFKDKMESIKNLLCAFHSMNTLLQMIYAHQRVHKFKYDAILVLRPDTAVLRDIDLPKYMNTIKKRPNATWIPGFQAYKGYNDRAAFGSLAAIAVYLERGIAFRDAPGVYPAAERLVKHELARHNITVYPSSIRVARVRQHGFVHEERKKMAMTDEEWDRCIVLENAQMRIKPGC